MDPLIIEGNDVRPDINFNASTGVLVMKGVAIPENVKEMFKPINKWLEEYSKNPQPATELIIYFDYLNTAAAKMVYIFCDTISDLHGNDNSNVKITWKYTRGDYEMLDLGEEILGQFVCFKEIVAVENVF
jgi:hypothetical protein